MASYPRLSARTRRFTLGEPRTATIAPDASRVLFLRSRHGTDPVTLLWSLDLDTGTERVVGDPDLLADPGGDLPEAEKRRRERARESASGIVGYACDRAVAQAAYALAGQLFATDVASGATTGFDTAPGVFDPRPSPTGDHGVAYVAGAELRLATDGGDRLLAGEGGPDVSWGSAEFVAGEEMGRTRGYWWAPDGTALLVARVDTGPVGTWYLADPAHPDQAPTAVRYPAAGTANAEVGVHAVGLDGSRRAVEWDAVAYPYLADVDWPEGRPPLLTVVSRDQRRLAVLAADPTAGTTTLLWAHDDPHWVELTPGAPRWWGEGLACLVDRDGARRLVVGDRAITPVDLQVRAVCGQLGDDLVVTASPAGDPTVTHVYRVAADGGVEPLTHEPGVHSATAAGDVVVVASTSMRWPGTRTTVRRGGNVVAELASLAVRPPMRPKASFHVVGERQLRSTLLLPRAAAVRDAGPLPVLLDPYGGPHAQRVTRARNAHLASQWFADQGFAVAVIDGRGTPGRGPDWERAVWGDLAGPVLEDQVDGLAALAAGDERLDLGRVAIRGWSFGGYLAALAVLRRPDVFHAAVAGAPVTDWRLYDTYYTERYLGDPADHPDHYERSDVRTGWARGPARPLLLVHGLADDNVVAAHTLRLSADLLAAGRPHQVLPLSGVTHMTPQEVVAENLLLLQLAFLRQALGLDG